VSHASVICADVSGAWAFRSIPRMNRRTDPFLAL
jgi:hypothetical protein